MYPAGACGVVLRPGGRVVSLAGFGCSLRHPLCKLVQMTPDDTELLRRAKAGDEHALNELIAALRPYLKAVAQKKLNPRVRVRKDPSDLVQETLEQGFRDFERFAGATQNELRAYLRKILERNAIDTMRAELDAFRRSVKAEYSLDGPADGAKIKGRLVAELTSPSQRAERNQQMERLLSAMEALPEAQRKALALWQQRYSYKEIAEELQKTESAAQSLVKHALKTLRVQFPDELVKRTSLDGEED